MKNLASLLLAGLLTATMIIPAAAAGGNDILNGTPVLDGKVDDIYLQSASYTITEDLVNYPFGGYADDLDYDATAYFLWDSDYLYIAVEAVDSTPTYRGDVAQEWMEWQNDAAELWISEDDVVNKVHSALNGKFFSEGKEAYDFSAAKNASAETENGWCTEVALPLSDLGVRKEFLFSLQVNNIITEDGSVGYAVGSQTPTETFVCVATVAAVEPEVVEPEVVEPEVAEPEVTVPEVVETETVATPVAAVVTAPQTFDAGVFAAVAAVVSAAGYMISKKK